MTVTEQQPPVMIDYYTDPLCCWSWSFEPVWQRIKNDLGDQLRVTLRMGGLLPDWNNYQDQENAVVRPAQMGPVWMHAAHVTGVPSNNLIWVNDPPVSSYPACIAQKAAALQSAALGEEFLKVLRTAVMQEGVNISRTDRLLSLATSFSVTHPSFDLRKFETDLLDGNGLAAFRLDMDKRLQLGITRFPTLVISRLGQRTKLVTGYKTYEQLNAIFSAD